MRIGVFVVDVGNDGAGLETYQVGLIRGLAAIDSENEYIIYCTHPNAAAAIGVEQPNFTYRVLRPSSRWLSLPVSLPAALVRDGVDFYHATMVPPPWSPKPYLMSILCFSSWSHPEFFSKGVLRRLNFLLETGIKNARYLLCNSANLMEDIRARFGVSEDRLAVTHLGVGPEFNPSVKNGACALAAERYGLDRPYLLFIGKNQERKNALGVVRAYGRFLRETDSDADLVLVGRKAEPSGPIHDAIEELGLQDRVKRLPYVPYEDLPVLYSAARMFLFPSHWEGFGLPVVESMACGTPVLTSRVTSLPEVAGDAAVIVNPASIDEIAEGMVQIETRPDFRDDLIKRGLERASIFTWENCARATIEYYDRMAAG